MVLWEMLTGKEPFEEYDSYDVFVDAVCYKHKRPDFPEGFPICLQELISFCWDRDVIKRPSFQEILDRINDAMLDISIVNDPAAAKMWKNKWPGELSISWNKFVTEYYSFLEIPYEKDRESDQKYKCLKFVLCPEKGDQQDTLVTLDRFGHFLKWFGPTHSASGNVLERLAELLLNKWFHGDISREKSESLLAAAEKGTYLVRLSATEPIERAPFTISKVTKTGEINHQRIYANLLPTTTTSTTTTTTTTSPNKKNSLSPPLTISYFTHIKHKTAVNTEKAEESLENLMTKVSTQLRLKKICPGWPYGLLFSQVDSVYQVDDDIANPESASEEEV